MRAAAQAWLLCCVIVAAAGCGGSVYTVGDTTVVVADDAVVWSDFDLALLRMQHTHAPTETWAVTVYLWDYHNYPWDNDRVYCWYKPSLLRIDIRITGACAANSSLPHELAHRWDHVANRPPKLDHGPVWGALETTLVDAAATACVP